MTRRRWVYMGLAAASLLGLGAWLLWPVPPAVGAYKRLRLGMTAEEVEAAIGEAPTARHLGLYTEWSGLGATVGGVPVFGPILRGTGIPYRDVLQEQPFHGWQWDDCELWVTYDRDGRVVGYYLMEHALPPLTLLDRIRSLLGI